MVGLVFAKVTPGSIVERVRAVADQLAPQLANDLGDVLSQGWRRKDREGKLRRHRDYFRALLLLAELEACIRNPALALPSLIGVGAMSFHSMLRENYPLSVVDELRELLQYAVIDLPRHDTVTYNPVLGGELGGVMVGADADLLIGDLLLELKASMTAHDPKWDTQLLCYAVLARKRGIRVRQLGVYNVRYRTLRKLSCEELARAVGYSSLDAFEQTVENALQTL